MGPRFWVRVCAFAAVLGVVMSAGGTGASGMWSATGCGSQLAAQYLH